MSIERTQKNPKFFVRESLTYLDPYRKPFFASSSGTWERRENQNNPNKVKHNAEQLQPKVLIWKSSQKLCSSARVRYILEQLSMKMTILKITKNLKKGPKIAKSINFLK